MEAMDIDQVTKRNIRQRKPLRHRIASHFDFTVPIVGKHIFEE